MDRLDMDATGPGSRDGDVQSPPRRLRLTCSSLLNAAVSTAVIVSGLNGLVQILRVIVEVSAEHAR
jgi:hypothetical protein